VRAPFPTDRNAPANLGAALYLRSTRSICEVKKLLQRRNKESVACTTQQADPFENLIFERNTFGIILLNSGDLKKAETKSLFLAWRDCPSRPLGQRFSFRRRRRAL